MPAFPDPFSDHLIDAELPWPACDQQPLRGEPADDGYYGAMCEHCMTIMHADGSCFCDSPFDTVEEKRDYLREAA